jgi:type I restriction enzyme R subunit
MSPEERFRRRHLPHWDLPGAICFVTTCLHGSIPARGLLDVSRYRKDLERRPLPGGLTADEWASRRWKLGFARAERWLDADPAVRHLADPCLARIVVETMYYFAGARYDLLAYVVMPSHLHWVFRPRDDWCRSAGPNRRPPRERIMHSLKTHTALECNRARGRQGSFWQQESYDHCVLDVEELERVIRYVEQNPVKAGLVETPERWPFSSAADRVMTQVVAGAPLVGRGS